MFFQKTVAPGLPWPPPCHGSLPGSNWHVISVEELSAQELVQVIAILLCPQRAGVGGFRGAELSQEQSRGEGWRTGSAVTGEWMSNWENKEMNG